MSESTDSVTSLSRILIPALAGWLAAASWAQQPNSGQGALYVQFRDGAPWPLTANAPNNGNLNTFVRGTPSMPFALALGPLNPSSIVTAGGQKFDLGLAPMLTDVALLGQGGGDPFVTGFFVLDGGGLLSTNWPIPPTFTGTLPGMQGILYDPTLPDGFRLTGASSITLKPSKSILFIQGDYNPGPLPNCRLSDTSPFGFSTLRDVLLAAGFNSVTEVLDTQVTVNSTLLGSVGLVVLGSNQRTFTANEISSLQFHARVGKGLLSYADAQFGPNNWNSDNGVLAAFGLGVAPDNFGGNVAFTNFVAHPITRGLDFGITAEGISLIQLGSPTASYALPPIALAPCSTNTGCLPIPAVPPLPTTAVPTWTAIAAAQTTGGGRVAVTCDRNTFLNPPGIGTSIEVANNLLYAVNLFYWAAGY